MFVARLACLHIDLPFTTPTLSSYGFFGSALTSSLTLSRLDRLPTPSGKHNAVSSFLPLVSQHYAPSLFHLQAIILWWVIITAITGGVLFGCPRQLQYAKIKRLHVFLMRKVLFWWLTLQVKYIFLSLWLVNPFQTPTGGCQKCIVTQPKEK